MVKLTTPFDAAAIAPQQPQPEVSTDGLSAAVTQLAETRYRHVPDAMRAGRWWMVALDKVPHKVTRNGHLHSLTQANVHDPANHCTFEEALAAISTNDSQIELMLVLGVGNAFVCVDLDDLDKAATEHRADAVEYQRQIKEHLTGTYCEISRSGKGLHFIGVAPEVKHDKAYAKHPHFQTDVLFRHGLVLTGDHCGEAFEIADISSQAQTILNSMDRRPAPDASLPSVDTITPAHCDESRLISILSTGTKNGEAFRTGRNVHDWSGTMAAVMNAAAQFCTDEATAYRVIERSGLVQLADDKGGETRLEKFNRLWPKEWPKALAKTEEKRLPNHAATALTKPLTLADLWKQSPFVQYMVQDRATSMIQENLIAGASAEDIAPLFRYLRPEKMNQLQDDLRRVNDAFAKTLTDARILVQNDTDTEVLELNAFMEKKVRQERVVNREARYQEYNRKFYVVKNYGGAARVFRNGFHDDSGAQDMWPSLGKFCEAQLNDQVLNWHFGRNELIPELVPFANEWVQKTHRRFARQEMRFETTDREITVDAGERVLNLFQGWVTIPVAGDWSAIRYLIHDILCSGSDGASEYLLNYLAHMIQKPHQLPGTAIILRSEEQGTGKSTFMALLRQLLGSRYCASTSDADHFVGTHNDRAMNKVLLHFEEAVAPNDRKIESRLKALITNETISYNPKGIAVIEARNFARVLMTSNAKQVAHLARHDRRMFVLDVSPKHANDPAFWGPFNAQYPREIEAFMHAMQTRDISGFRPTVMPHTEAKDAQKVESIVGTDRTLRMILEDGRLPPCSGFDGHSWDVRVSALTDFFIKYRFEVGGKTPQPAKVFKPITLARGFKRLTVGDAAKSYRVLTLPRLQEARRLFLEDQRIVAHDWGDDPDADWALD